MKLEGTVTINASREKVWAGITDPNLVSSCAPGLQSMEVVIPEKQFKAVAAVGFGSVKATFNADIEWLELDPPNYAKMKAHADTPGSAVDVTSEMKLTSSQPEITELGWNADVVINGSIASLAARLMGGMTKKMAGTFFECFKSKIET